MTSSPAMQATRHPLRLLTPVPAAPLPPPYSATPLARRPLPDSTAPAATPAQPYAQAPLWRDDTAALAPALPNDAGSAHSAARLLLAFLLDGAASDDEAPLCVHLPGSHDGDFAWQLWQELQQQAGELGLPPLRFCLYHAQPTLARAPGVAQLLADGHWRLCDGDPAPQPGRHAALIAHGHYARQPAALAWCHYGEAWHADVSLCDDGVRWRLTPADAQPAALREVHVGADHAATPLAPLFADPTQQVLVAPQQGRADCGVVTLPLALLEQVERLRTAHPQGVLVYVADAAHGPQLPQALPATLDPITPLNAEALARRWPELTLRLERDNGALLLCGVLHDAAAIWPLTTLTQRTLPRALLAAHPARPTPDTLHACGHNPRALAPWLEALQAQTPDPAARADWCQALDLVWQRSLPGAGYHFDLGCLAMHWAHYGVARAAFLDVLAHAGANAPALHNLALLEMLTGDAERCQDILSLLEQLEPQHAKTRRLRQRVDTWLAQLLPRLGWDPARGSDGGLCLSPLQLHHARELAWACRHAHDLALTRLPDLGRVAHAAAWIAGELDDDALVLAILHPAAGLLGMLAIRRADDGGADNLCVYIAPEWRERGVARQAIALLAGPYRSEVLPGNARSLAALAAPKPALHQA